VRRSRAALATALVALVAACAPRGSQRKEPIARLQHVFLKGSAAVSEDHKHYAYLVQDADGTRMVRDGVADENYHVVTNRSFTPKAHRHVYWARRDDNQRMIVVDGIPTPIGFSRHEYVVFDSTGTHWAALATTEDGGPDAIVLRDGEVLGPFPNASVPAWSPSGTLAYLRHQGQPFIAQRTELVVGDQVVRENVGTAATCLPSLDEEFEGPDLPRFAMVRYLADGRLVTLMPRDAGWALMRGDETLATFDASVPTSTGSVGPYSITGPEVCTTGSVIAASSVTTAEKGDVVVWWERPAGSTLWRVMVNGRPVAGPGCLRPWPHQPPQVTAEGRMVSFPCSRRFDDQGEAIEVVHGLTRYGPYPEVWALALSNDGSHLAYGATDDSRTDAAWGVYDNDRLVSERYYAIWRPRFDPSATHLAWEAMRSDSGPNILVLDNRVLATFDDLIDGPIFDRPNEVGWIIRKKRRLARVNFPLAP
jgi:hypothetical protein